MPRTYRLKPGLAALAAIASFALPAAAQAAPDLRVAIEFAEPQPAAPNTEITVRTRITNASRETVNLNLRTPGGAAVHVIRWYYVESGKPDKFVLAMSMQGELRGFSNKWLNAKFKIPNTAKPGNHQICAVVDPTNAIPETNEGNNRACTPLRVKGSPGIAARPGVKLEKQPRIVGPGPAVKPGVLQRQCINPAIVELQVGIISKDPRNRFQGTIQLKAVLKNIGNADYVTGANQQSVQIHYGRRLLKNERFGNLRVGETKIIAVQLPWNAAEEFQGDLKAQIVYDPDIRTDGNPNNDDCNMRDNSKTVPPATANKLFTG
jgi:hypothetical protein